ncbi:MAG: RNA polymerase sigma factor, partial [Gemmataceae bacterium]
MTVFVWAGDQQDPTSDTRKLGEVRKEAFELLVERTRERLRRYLLQRAHCHDADLAEDIVQQVLIKLYLRAEQFDPRRSFWGWLYRIARNEYIDALRRLRPGDVGQGQTGRVEEEMAEWLANLTIDSAQPDADMIEREKQQQLERAIASLPQLQRTIVRLKAEGIKGKDIAQQLGISQAYVSQLFHEAG